MSAVVAVAPLAVLYALGLARARKRAWWPAACWALGLVALAVATSPALDRAADRELSLHMVQHELLGLVAAPLLVAGAPVRLALATTHGRTRRRLAAVLRLPVAGLLTRPAAGVAAFVAVLAVVHVPAVYDLSLRSGAVHAVVHAALLWSAVLLWLPLVRVDPLPHRASPAATVAALIAAMAAMAAFGAALAAQQHVVYTAYLGRGADPLADQRVAAGLMSVGGMLAMVPALLVLAWRALVAEERRAVARERAGAATPAPRLPAGGAR